jgi:mRNA export factor
MSALFGSTASTPSAQGDLSKDVPVKDLPTDSISQISFSTKSDHLAVSSWDNKVRIYAIDNSGNSEGKALFDFDAPALGVCWAEVRLFKERFLMILT